MKKKAFHSNSGITSLQLGAAISLDQKRNTMAQCLDSLNALREAVREGAAFKATR